jgi:AcrR family transcriptional regulator
MARELTPRGAATRGRIVAGAAALIRERGIAAVSMDDIRAATATSKSQLFHYFPGGRLELLGAVTQHEADQVLEDQRPEIDDLSTWKSWQAWERVVIERYARQGENCPMTALTSELGKSSPEARVIVRTLFDRWQRLLAEGVRALQSSGEGSPAVDPDEAAAIILAALQGGVLILMTTGSITHLEAALDAATTRLLAAVTVG